MNEHSTKLVFGTDTPITGSAKEARLRDVLSRLLDPFELSFMVRNETLQITTPEVLDQNLAVRFYPIHDLLVGEDEDRAEMMDDIVPRGYRLNRP